MLKNKELNSDLSTLYPNITTNKWCLLERFCFYPPAGGLWERIACGDLFGPEREEMTSQVLSTKPAEWQTKMKVMAGW